MSSNFSERQALLERSLDRHPLTIPPNTLVHQAISLMSASRSSYALIVQNQQLLGIFTERDIVRLTASKMPLEQIDISQVMTSNLITLSIAEADSVFSVLARLRSAKIRHLPITNESGDLLGVFTAESLRANLHPSDLLKIRLVAEVMATEIVTAAPNTSLFQIAQLMATHRKSCVVICDRENEGSAPETSSLSKPLGIITERDIVKFTIQQLDIYQTLAATVMSCPLQPTQINLTLWHAHQLMQKYRIRRLVVVNEAGYLAGIVTQSSLLQILEPTEMYATVELLEHVVAEKTQQLQQINQQMQAAEVQLRQANENLEAQVERRTQELTRANAELASKNRELQQALQELKATQSELIQSEKMAALGQLIAGVTHEINNPLSAIRASATNLDNSLTQILERLPAILQQLDSERHSDFLALLHRSIFQKQVLSNKEIRQARKALISQLEAEAIANPEICAATLVDMGIYDNIQPILNLLTQPKNVEISKLAYEISNLFESSYTIIKATEITIKLVMALKRYAHYDHSHEKKLASIIDGINTVLTVFNHQLNQGIETVKNYDYSVTEIPCYADELNQVWTNLLQNALQAMDNKGTLTIDVAQQNGSVVVSFTDTGKGIPPEVLPKIFEPFFTTKPPGIGSGLGLDIVKKIIERHQGKIEVTSQPGETKFIISIPM